MSGDAIADLLLVETVLAEVSSGHWVLSTEYLLALGIVQRGWTLSEWDSIYADLPSCTLTIIAGVLGFGGIASTAAGIARFLFFIFLVVFLVALATGMARRRGPPI